MKSNDWRLLDQEEYLYNKKLIKIQHEPYKKDWDHEHCEFCNKKITNKDDAYCTIDKYYWICNDCFADFKNIFMWDIEK